MDNQARTKKVKTAELEGAELDWSVATITGQHGPYICKDAGGYFCVVHWPCFTGEREYSPSTDWDCGGQIIEREQLALLPVVGGIWSAEWATPTGGDDYYVNSAYGKTPLIAAMRAFVASKLGDEVEVPV